MNRQKVSYFINSFSKIFYHDYSCPSCGSNNTKLLYRKFLVTSLRECLLCGLRFRVPKDHFEDTIRFYQSNYVAGFTTYLPSDDELMRLLSEKFKGSEKDFSKYIEVIYAIGGQRGEKILDFGSSWGYGSWQLIQAGFDVYSYEIDQLRADYAKYKLGCRVVDGNNFDSIKYQINYVFCSHVLEHLTDPNIFWDVVDQVLMPGGKTVCFVPNGDPIMEINYGKRRYHQLWGQVHPLLFTRKSLISLAERYQYKPFIYSFPCPINQIKENQTSNMNNNELLLVAVRPTEKK